MTPIALKGTLAVICGAVALSCSSDSTGPGAAECTAETASVTATVTVDTSVSFDWQPRCAVAMVLVEQDASDQWGISSDDELWTSPDLANAIGPPLSYGAEPSGTATFEPPATLVPGETYELILWRILPSGSTAQCLQRFENACLLAVHEFTR